MVMNNFDKLRFFDKKKYYACINICVRTDKTAEPISKVHISLVTNSDEKCNR